MERSKTIIEKEVIILEGIDVGEQLRDFELKCSFRQAPVA